MSRAASELGSRVGAAQAKSRAAAVIRDAAGELPIHEHGNWLFLLLGSPWLTIFACVLVSYAAAFAVALLLTLPCGPESLEGGDASARRAGVVMVWFALTVRPRHPRRMMMIRPTTTTSGG